MTALIRTPDLQIMVITAFLLIQLTKSIHQNDADENMTHSTFPAIKRRLVRIPENRWRNNGKRKIQNKRHDYITSEKCVDNDGFLDYLQIPCSFHKRTLNCKSLTVIGYSSSMVRDVLANCPKSCGICKTDMPSASPTAPHAAMLKAWKFRADRCVDNPAFRDKIGFLCYQHFWTENCRRLDRVGYSELEINDVLRNCPNSCKVCELWGPSMVPSMIPTKFPIKIPSKSPSSFPTEFPTISRSRRPSVLPSPTPSTHPTFPPSTESPTLSPTKNCRDEADFRDFLGLPCNKHSNNVCQNAEFLMGYPPLRVWELKIRCPFSCGYCTTEFPSLSPSFTPSDSKIPSPVPSFTPTLTLSNFPSNEPSSSPTVFPTLQPTNTCDDNKDFTDRFGLNCLYYQIISDCKTLINIGYSIVELKNAIDSCPLSCGYCVTALPSEIPSAVPTKGLTKTPTPTETPTKLCHDSASFLDSNGLKCKNHSRIVCEKIGILGYKQKEIAEIIKNCPLSCKVCGVTQRPTIVPSISPTALPTSSSTMLPTVSPTSSCRDQKTYRDHNNFSCKKFRTFNCENMSVLGYTLKQVSQLISNCPKSCRYC